TGSPGPRDSAAPARATLHHLPYPTVSCRSAQREFSCQRVSSADCRGATRPATRTRTGIPGPARPSGPPPRIPRVRAVRARPDTTPGHRIAMTIAAKFEIEYLQYL